MITITETLYKKMPDDIKACFNQLPNPSSEEVRDCFPDTKSGSITKDIVQNNAIKFNASASGVSTARHQGDSGNASRFFKSIKQPYTYKGKEYEVEGFVKSCKPQAPSNYNDEGSPARYFKSIIYTAKASKSERNKGCEELEKKFTKTMNDGIGKREHNENEPTAYNQNNHPTVKPIALMEYLIKMITPKGGIVLDPFSGSGSTLVAAKENGFDFIGIEKEPEYIKIIEARTGIKAEVFDKEIKEVAEVKQEKVEIKSGLSKCCNAKIIKGYCEKCCELVK